MNIDKFTDAIKNCRFCFMCRHLSAIGNVTFTEADTPRIRAAMIYGLKAHPEWLKNPDFIDTIYRSDLSAACRFHCVSHFDENGLNLAMRADIVEAGLAPDYVRAIVSDLVKTEKWSVKGTGKVLWFEDMYTAEAKDVAKSFDKVMKANRTAYRTVTGGCIGKALKVLGFVRESKAAAKKFAGFINRLGAETLVVSNPAAYDALVNDFREFGIRLEPKVMHSSEFFTANKFRFSKKAGTVYYLESDFLKNYNAELPFPKQLLESMKAKLVQFGTNNEESYTCGEGAVVLPKISAEIVEKLAKYIEERADNPKKDVIAVASPYTKIQLGKFTSLNVKTLEELAAENL